MPSTELVLTTRRARWRMPEEAWVAGRLRLTERRLVLTAPDVPDRELLLGEIAGARLLRRPRGAVLAIAATAGTVRLRCFEVSAVAALIRGAIDRSR